MPVASKLKTQPEKPQSKSKGALKFAPPIYDDIESSLKKAVDEALARDTYFEKQSGTFAPSGTNQCPRFMVYRFTGYNHHEEFRGQTIRIFDNGNDLEDRAIEYFKDMGVYLDSNIEVSLDKPPIRGFIDILIAWNGPKIIECKSINDGGFAKVKAMHKPKDEHYRQIQSYFACTDYVDGFVLYINKNTQEYLPLYVKKDEEFLAKMFEKYGIIYNVHLEGNLPARPYKQTSTNCKRCPAYKHCWEDSNDGVPVKL